MRRGKEIAQGSHASLAFLFDENRKLRTELNDTEQIWMDNGHAKICCQVSSEQELLDLHKLAKEAGISSNVILDEGVTEFHGEYTYTALAIGPDYSSKIDPICRNLRLY